MPDPGSTDGVPSTHPVWLIAGAGLLAIAASMEVVIAGVHGVSVASIHEHTAVPGLVHALAVGSIPMSLFPVYRTRHTSGWLARAVTGVVVAALLLMGQTLTAGFAALLVSAGALLWRRRKAKGRA